MVCNIIFNTFFSIFFSILSCANRYAYYSTRYCTSTLFMKHAFIMFMHCTQVATRIDNIHNSIHTCVDAYRLNKTGHHTAARAQGHTQR